MCHRFFIFGSFPELFHGRATKSWAKSVLRTQILVKVTGESIKPGTTTLWWPFRPGCNSDKNFVFREVDQVFANHLSWACQACQACQAYHTTFKRSKATNCLIFFFSLIFLETSRNFFLVRSNTVLVEKKKGPVFECKNHLTMHQNKSFLAVFRFD